MAERPFPDMHFEKILACDGTQTIVGLLRSISSKKRIVFKIPYDADYSTRLQYEIGKIVSFAPKCLGLFECGVIIPEKGIPCKDDPFVKEGMSREVLFEEYIEGPSFGMTLRKYNRNEIISIVLQVLATLEHAQQQWGFVHYDLHTDNIIITKTSESTVQIGNHTIPTFGNRPQIIDFGFSYIKGQKGYVYPRLENTDLGCLSCLYDPYYDARIFLVNLISDLPYEIEPFTSRILAEYQELKYDNRRGWDSDSRVYSVTGMLVSIFETTYLETYRDDPYFFCHMLSTLVTYPIKDNRNGNVMEPFPTFEREFRKIEVTVKCKLSRQELLRSVIEGARLRKSYEDVLNLPFYVPSDNVDEFKMVEALWECANRLKTIIARVLTKKMKDKKQEYQKLSSITNIIDTVKKELN